MTDRKHPAAYALDDERTYAADVDMSRSAREIAKPKARSDVPEEEDVERRNADAIAAATSQNGQT